MLESGGARGGELGITRYHAQFSQHPQTPLGNPLERNEWIWKPDGKGVAASGLEMGK